LVSRARELRAQPWVSVSAGVRVAMMFTAGVVVGITVGLAGQWPYAPLCGWDAAAIVFTLWVWLAVRRMNSSATAAHATRENPGRAVSDVIVVIAAIASLGAVSIALVRANSSQGVAQHMLALLAVASVALSWFTVHTLFMLRYAQTGGQSATDAPAAGPRAGLRELNAVLRFASRPGPVRCAGVAHGNMHSLNGAHRVLGSRGGSSCGVRHGGPVGPSSGC
jgi:uncharacterized membrane protein